MIEELVNKTLKEKEVVHSKRKRSGKYNPSSLGRCYRLQFFNRKNVGKSNPPDARDLRVLQCGTMFHEWIQGLLPFEYKTEIKCEVENYLGYADIVTDKVVVDLKSQHSKAFWHMTREGYEIKKRKFPAILQVMFYAYTLNKPEGKLVFISKDDLCIKEYTFRLDAWKEEVEKEMKTLDWFWSNGICPKAEPRAYLNKDGTLHDCDYCDWRDYCGEINQEDFQWNSTK